MKKRRKRKNAAKAARDRAWRELSARKRAQAGACEVCGGTERLCVHHVLEKKQHPDLQLEEKDLVVLCGRHHFMVHHGRHYELLAWLEANKPEQFAWIMERARQKASLELQDAS